MRIGVLPLLLSVVVAATRLTGAVLAADALACIYLAVITARLTRADAFVATERA